MVVKGPGHGGVGAPSLPYPSTSQGSPSRDSSPARLSPGLISAAQGLLPTAFPHAFRPVASRWGGPLPGNWVAGRLGRLRARAWVGVVGGGGARWGPGSWGRDSCPSSAAPGTAAVCCALLNQGPVSLGHFSPAVLDDQNLTLTIV